jgi:ABC-type lipoprotein export system ATPase subunit
MHGIRFGGACTGLSLSPGGSCELIVGSPAHKRAVLDSLLSQIKGCIVEPDGGLISNLAVIENIALPAEFHGVGSAADRDSRLSDLTRHFGKDGALLRALDFARPADLSAWQKRLASFLRAMLMEPELIVFDSLFGGIGRADASKVREFRRIFHLHFPFRQAVYVAYAEEPMLQGLVDQTIHLQKPAAAA